MKSRLSSFVMRLAVSLLLVATFTSVTRAQQGRFRVTLTGFIANKATIDNVLSLDGAGDEVFAMVNFAEIWQSNRIFGALQTRTSLTYGDTAGRPGPFGSALLTQRWANPR